MPGIFQIVSGGDRVELRSRGRYFGLDGSGNGVYVSTPLRDLGSVFQPGDYLPLAASITVTQGSRTTATVTIAPGRNPPPRTGVDTYQVYRSTNGADAVLVGTVAAGSAPSFADTGLPTATPENTFAYYVLAVNNDGVGPASNTFSVQWSGTIPLQQPTAPTGLAASSIQSTSALLTWAETVDATVTKHGIFASTAALTPLVDNIPAGAVSYPWAGLPPDTNQPGRCVRRFNGWAGGSPAGWSPASNPVTFKTTPVGAGGTPQFQGHVPGKVYLGWATSESPESNAESQVNTQTPIPAGGLNYASTLGVRRLYNKVQGDIDHADANNRVLWISAKPDDMGAAAGVTGWGQIASGSRDSGIVSYFADLITGRNKLTIFTFHHEPVGDVNDPSADGVTYCNAFQRIMQVVDTNYPGHRILFCPLYEENRLRNLKVAGLTIDWAKWLPQNILPGKGGPRPWDFTGWDIYQYAANTSTTAKAGVQFSHRWWRIDGLFDGTFTPAGSTPMPWMNYTPGVDMIYGLGEASARPGAFYDSENGGPNPSNMTGAKYARDMYDYIFDNVDKFAFVSWFNSIGADPNYNDERLYPGGNAWGGKSPNHPAAPGGSVVTQTGDTEITLNIYREKIATGLTVKLAANGLPPA